jgi:DNA helicase B
MTALRFPKIMEFLPVLLPRYFRQLISSGSGKVLEVIEEVLGTQPWKLGFSKVSKTFVLHLATNYIRWDPSNLTIF